jgi:hypothetical protein
MRALDRRILINLPDPENKVEDYTNKDDNPDARSSSIQISTKKKYVTIRPAIRDRSSKSLRQSIKNDNPTYSL